MKRYDGLPGEVNRVVAKYDPATGTITITGDDDTIDLRDGEADEYTCGAGVDTVAADPFDSVLAWAAGTCETVDVQPMAPAN